VKPSVSSQCMSDPGADVATPDEEVFLSECINNMVISRNSSPKCRYMLHFCRKEGDGSFASAVQPPPFTSLILQFIYGP